MQNRLAPALQHDPHLRAAARAIFEAVYPSDDWSPVRWLEAERFGTIHYRQAVEAAQLARGDFQQPDQPSLLRAAAASASPAIWTGWRRQ